MKVTVIPILIVVLRTIPQRDGKETGRLGNKRIRRPPKLQDGDWPKYRGEALVLAVTQTPGKTS